MHSAEKINSESFAYTDMVSVCVWIKANRFWLSIKIILLFCLMWKVFEAVDYRIPLPELLIRVSACPFQSA